jgi:hypothetical protein
MPGSRTKVLSGSGNRDQGPPAAGRSSSSLVGDPLPISHRAALEAPLGHTLDDVRIHADQSAHDLATYFAARAFTTGRDIFFRGGEYAPDTPAGLELLTHEVVHVVQQGEATPGGEALRVSRPTIPMRSRRMPPPMQ